MDWNCHKSVHGFGETWGEAVLSQPTDTPLSLTHGDRCTWIYQKKCELICWGQNERVPIVQTKCFHALSWMKIALFWLKIHWHLDPIGDKPLCKPMMVFFTNAYLHHSTLMMRYVCKLKIWRSNYNLLQMYTNLHKAYYVYLLHKDFKL